MGPGFPDADGDDDAIRVLHVDDDPDFAELTATFLQKEDSRFSVETVTRAQQGLTRLHDGFDCIISDYDMPERDGIEFLRSVRRVDQEIPFLLFTGKGSEEVASDAIAAGVTEYLQKERGHSQFTVLANRIKNAVKQYRSQRQFDASQKRLSLLIEQSPLGVLEYNADFEIVHVNTKGEEIFGYSEDELIGETWEKLVTSASYDNVDEVTTALARAEGGYHSIDENVRKNGERFLCEWFNRLVTDDNGDVVAIVSMFQDVTRREQRRETLEHTTARLEALLEHSPDMINVHDLEGRIIDPNSRLVEATGYTPEELSAMKVWDVDAMIDAETAKTLWKSMAVGEARKLDGEYERRDGSTFPVEVHVRRLDLDGDDRFMVIARDISERVEREQELERTNLVLMRLFEALPAGILVENEAQSIEAINSQLMDLFDVPGAPDDIIGRPCASIEPDVRDRFVDPDAFVDRLDELRSTAEAVYDEQFPVLEGKTFAQTHVPLDLPAGTGHLWMYRDISEQVDRRQALKRQEAFLENSPDAFYLIDSEGIVRFQSHASEQIHGYETRDHLGESVEPYIHPDDQAEIRGDFESLLAHPDDPVLSEYRYQIPSGEWRWYENRAVNRLDDPLVEGIIVINRDITDRKEHESRLKALTQTSRELMSARTRSEVVELGGDAARDVLGLSANSIYMLDPEATDLEPIYTTDEVHELVGDPPRLQRGDSIAWRVFDSGDSLALDDVTADPDVYSSETRIKSELYLPIGEYGLLIAGSATAQAFDQQDISLGEILAETIARALEQVEQTEQLRTRERELTRQNERLEGFASVVSHDLRNPLNVAQGRLHLAKEDCESEHLRPIERAHERMNTLIDDLLTLAREGEAVTSFEAVDLAELAGDCWENVQTAEAELSVTTTRELVANGSRLQQLLENLFRNAVEHGGADVKVTVGELADGFYIEDSGVGIPSEKQEDIFDTGYSTSTDGTGFGLSIVEEIAESHGWSIHVAEGTSGGVRFEITDVEFANE